MSFRRAGNWLSWQPAGRLTEALWGGMWWSCSIQCLYYLVSESFGLAITLLFRFCITGVLEVWGAVVELYILVLGKLPWNSVKYSQDIPLTNMVTGGLTLFTNWNGADHRIFWWVGALFSEQTNNDLKKIPWLYISLVGLNELCSWEISVVEFLWVVSLAPTLLDPFDLLIQFLWFLTVFRGPSLFLGERVSCLSCSETRVGARIQEDVIRS